jgi:hypothetical protein
MVLRYAHPSQERQMKAMDKVEKYVREQKAELTRSNADSGSPKVF